MPWSCLVAAHLAWRPPSVSCSTWRSNVSAIQTRVARIPIVPAAVLFDLGLGDARIRPDKRSGYLACKAAKARACEEGNVGAGTGATVGKMFGMDRAMKGGLGASSIQVGPFVVAALVAVNAFGDVLDPATGTVLAGARTHGRQDSGQLR